MKNVLRFWLEKGASGFRVDAVNHLFEVEDLRDEPIDNPEDNLSYGYTHKHYTKDLVRTQKFSNIGHRATMRTFIHLGRSVRNDLRVA